MEAEAGKESTNFKPMAARWQGFLWKRHSHIRWRCLLPPAAWAQALFHGGWAAAQGLAGGGSRSAWISRSLISFTSSIRLFTLSPPARISSFGDGVSRGEGLGEHQWRCQRGLNIALGTWTGGAHGLTGGGHGKVQVKRVHGSPPSVHDGGPAGRLGRVVALGGQDDPLKGAAEEATPLVSRWRGMARG